jgi:predicted ATPase
MITKFAIENFKSIGKPGVSLELKPLTILVGPNGSGKSNILEALALFAQNIGRQGFDYRLNYPYLINYSSMEDIAHKRILDNWATMEIHAGLEAEEATKLSDLAEAVNQANLGLTIDKVDPIGYRYSSKLKDVTETRQSILSGEKQLITASYIRTDETSWKPAFEYPPLLLPANPGDPTHLLAPGVFTQSGKVVEEAQPLNNFAQAAVKAIASKLRTGSRNKVFFISSLRGEVRTEADTSGKPEWVGKKGENLLQILSLVSAPEHKKKLEKIHKWASEFGLKEPWAGWKGEQKLGAEFEDPELNSVFKLALASHGSRQALSIIVQLFWSESGDIIMIEEPEMSLHPDSQAKLPELFAEAIQAGKQIIITTHSLILPLALNRPIEKGLLESSDIAVWHIKKEPEGTIAERLELTEKGYIKGWIPSFADTEIKLMKEWAHVLPEM